MLKKGDEIYLGAASSLRLMVRCRNCEQMPPLQVPKRKWHDLQHSERPKSLTSQEKFDIPRKVLNGKAIELQENGMEKGTVSMTGCNGAQVF